MKSIKKSLLVAALSVGLLSACQPSTSTRTDSFVLPERLKHCKVIRMDSGGVPSDRLYLIECPPGTVLDGFIGTSSMQTHGKTTLNVTTTII